jgi:hypothetical protein
MFTKADFPPGAYDGTHTAVIDEKRDIITYVERPYARSAGSGNFAYAMMNLPPLTPIGPATANLKRLRITQPMVRPYMQVQVIQNLGGLQAGQMYRQPLVNPDR